MGKWRSGMGQRLRLRVLVIENDKDIAALVEVFLSSEGYGVTIVQDAQSRAIQDAVAQVEPDCILLDGGASNGYDQSWETAALIAHRVPAIPVIMFTGHVQAITEAQENTSARS